MSISAGEKMLLSILVYGNMTADHSGNEFLLSLQRAGRYLRWLACSSLPDVYDALRTGKRCAYGS